MQSKLFPPCGQTRGWKSAGFVYIGCYTGLRFSNPSQLSKSRITKDGSVVMVNTPKTREIVMIPLKGQVKKIPICNKDIPPEAYSNQKMNEYFKELGEPAEIAEGVLLTATKGRKRITESFKKFTLITTHTACRSFATNAYLQNVPTSSIMKITGHRTGKSFLEYLNISQENPANKLIKYPFFA